MKIEADKHALAAAIEAVMPAVSARSHRAAGCIRVIVEDDDAHFCAENGKVGIRFRAGSLYSTEPGEMLIPAHAFAKAVASAPSYSSRITVEASPSDRGCHTTVSHEARTIELDGPAIGKPSLVPPAVDGKIFVLAKTRVMGEALERISICASSAPSDAVLRGVALCFEVDSATMDVVATDLDRLGTYAVPMGLAARITRSIVVPARAASMIGARLQASRDHPISALFSLTGRPGIGVRCGRWTAWVRSIEGIFPAWRSQLPAGDSAAVVDMDGAELKAALEIASCISSVRPPKVRLHFGVHSRLSVLGEVMTATETLRSPRVRSGDAALSVAFDLRGFVDMVSMFGATTITAHLNADDTPSVFEADGWRYVLRPSLDDGTHAVAPSRRAPRDALAEAPVCA